MSQRTWKTRPAYYIMLEVLAKKGAMSDSDLFAVLVEELPDLGFKDFNELLLRLEVAGKIRMTSMSRGKKRIETIA